MDDRMEARLRDEVIVTGYEALPDVYEWLIPAAKLTPEGSVAALGDLVQSLPSSGRPHKEQVSIHCRRGSPSLRCPGEGAAGTGL